MAAIQASRAEHVHTTAQLLKELSRQLLLLEQSVDNPADYFKQFLQQTVAHLGSVGGAVWVREDGGSWKLQHSHQLDHCLQGLNVPEEHAALLESWDAASGIRLINCREDRTTDCAPQVIVVMPIASVEQSTFVVELFLPPGRPRTDYEKVARVLHKLSPTITAFLRRFANNDQLAREMNNSAFLEFVRQAHGSLELKATCYAIANESRRLVGCDRLSVVVCRHGRYQVEAISGQDVFDRRSDSVRAMAHLAKVIGNVREPLWYHGDASTLPPQIQEAVRHYVDISECRSLAVLPLTVTVPEEAEPNKKVLPAPPVGVLVVEKFTQMRAGGDFRPLLEAVSEQATIAVRNALEHRSLFLMPLLKWIGRSQTVQTSRRWPCWAMVTGTILATLGLLFLIPADFSVEGQGSLEPIVRQDIFTATPGVVQTVHVKHGQHVMKGKPLLRLRNVDMEVEQARLQGELSSTAERLTSVRIGLLNRRDLSDTERTRLAGEEAQLRQKLQSLQLQLELFERRLSQLLISSPIDGDVITWDVHESLMNRPVQPGQLLLTVAQTNAEWELLVQMPEKRMGHVLQAWQESQGRSLNVSFMLISEPGVTYRGELIELHGRAEQNPEKESSVQLRVRFDKSRVSKPRPGALATVKVYCGQRSLGYVWMHDIWEFVESRLLF